MADSLTLEEERDLIRRFQAGDRRAGDLVVRAYNRWLHKMSRPWARRFRLSYEDAVGAARIGFALALQKYDFERSDQLRISTLARWYILEEMKLLVIDSAAAVSLPRDRATRDIFMGKMDRRDEMIAKYGVSEEAMQVLATVFWTPATPVAHTEPDVEDGKSLEYVVAADDGGEDALVEGMDKPCLIERMREVISRMPDDRDRAILERRYLSGEDVATLRDVGKELGISAERVRQIEQRAIQELRAEMERSDERHRAERANQHRQRIAAEAAEARAREESMARESKLTLEDGREIARRMDGGESVNAIATDLGVTWATAKTWADRARAADGGEAPAAPAPRPRAEREKPHQSAAVQHLDIRTVCLAAARGDDAAVSMVRAILGAVPAFEAALRAIEAQDAVRSALGLEPVGLALAA